MTIAAMAALFIWFARQTDAIATEQARERIMQAIDAVQSQTELLTADYGHWTAAYEWVIADDVENLYDSVGSGAAEGDTFDFIYILGPDGSVRHVYVNDIYESDLSQFNPIYVENMLPALRDAPLDPYAAVSSLKSDGNTLTTVSAGRIQPLETENIDTQSLPIMIGGKHISTDQIMRDLLLAELRVLAPDSAIPPGNVGLTFLGRDQQPVAQLAWQPPRPGSELLAQATPAIGLLVLLLVLGSACAAQISGTQTAALIREKEFARTDPATGLLNRKGFTEIAEGADFRHAIESGQAAVMFVDMNGLKQLNDIRGHHVGDAAIRILASRLQAAVRTKDNVARIGGDEFVCLIRAKDPHKAAQEVARRFERLSAKEIAVDGHVFHAKASIGIAIAQQQADWQTLLTQADAAMYEAKQALAG